MGTLKTIIFIVFFLDSALLVIAVLLQSGRGGGLAGALGGISGADSALGVRAASQIEKATAVLGLIFLLCALALGLIAGSESGSGTEARVGGRTTTPPAALLAPDEKAPSTSVDTTTGAAAASPTTDAATVTSPPSPTTSVPATSSDQ